MYNLHFLLDTSPSHRRLISVKFSYCKAPREVVVTFMVPGPRPVGGLFLQTCRTAAQCWIGTAEVKRGSRILLHCTQCTQWPCLEEYPKSHFFFKRKKSSKLKNLKTSRDRPKLAIRPSTRGLKSIGSVVSTMFCKKNPQKKNFFLRGHFRPLPNKNLQILDQFFPVFFPKDIGHPTSVSGGKKTVKRYLKS